MMRLTALLCMMAFPAQAQNVTAQFQDGAPKDRLVVYNNDCPIRDAVLVFDLEPTRAEVILDTVVGGPGVGVANPIEAEEGDVVLMPVADGGRVLHMSVGLLPVLGAIVVTMDVDSTTDSSGQIIVQGSEVAGATISIARGNAVVTATFDSLGQAELILPPGVADCVTS